MRKRRAGNRIGVAAIVVGLASGATAAVLLTREPPGTQTGPPVVLKTGCPAVLPGTSNALDDYADSLVWQSRSYIHAGQVPENPGQDSPVPREVILERKVTAVGCSLSDPAATEGQRIAPGTWTDGTATGLASGTAVHAVRGVAPSCVLGVRPGNEVLAYVAVDLSGDWSPLC